MVGTSGFTATKPKHAPKVPVNPWRDPKLKKRDPWMAEPRDRGFVRVIKG